MMLYSWGVCFNALALLYRDTAALSEGGLLQGYTPLVMLLIVNNALVGLAISAILKYAGSTVMPWCSATDEDPLLVSFSCRRSKLSALKLTTI